MTIHTDITVAGLVVQSGHALIVREHARGRIVSNLPGGHIEAGESAEQAVVRELHEETGLTFAPEYILGCYLWLDPDRARQYLRIVYVGDTPVGEPAIEIDDPNIVESRWESLSSLIRNQQEHRYPIVAKSLLDFESGKRMAIDELKDRLSLVGDLDAVTASAQRL